jgi:hypothetical protein
VRLDVIVWLVRARNTWRRDAGRGDARGVSLDVVVWLICAWDSWGRDAGSRDTGGVRLDVLLLGLWPSLWLLLLHRTASFRISETVH